MSCLEIDFFGPLDDTEEVTLALEIDLEIFLSDFFGIAPSGVGVLGAGVNISF